MGSNPVFFFKYLQNILNVFKMIKVGFFLSYENKRSTKSNALSSALITLRLNCFNEKSLQKFYRKLG